MHSNTRRMRERGKTRNILKYFALGGSLRADAASASTNCFEKGRRGQKRRGQYPEMGHGRTPRLSSLRKNFLGGAAACPHRSPVRAGGGTTCGEKH